MFSMKVMWDSSQQNDIAGCTRASPPDLPLLEFSATVMQGCRSAMQVMFHEMGDAQGDEGGVR